MQKARITLADVAADAGVSKATASLVVRETGRVAVETRERVRSSMDALGYIYNRGAASLRSGRTQSVGVLVSDIENIFTTELVAGLESTLAVFDVVTLTANTLENPERQRLLVRSMLERLVDGLIVIPAIGTSSGFVQYLSELSIPVVIASREIATARVSYVGIDNRLGGRLAAEHLLSHDVRSLSYLGGFDELGPRSERRAGVIEALEAASADPILDIDIPGPPRGAWGRSAMQKLSNEGTIPEAMICHNDQVAFGVYRAVRESAPEYLDQIRVVSFDDVSEATLWEPPLTTVAASGHEVGVRCAEVLSARMDGSTRSAERALIFPRLVERQSCGCPPPPIGADEASA